MMKECTKCKEVKPYSEFHKNKTGKDGLRSNCKDCQKQLHKQYYEENKDKIKQYNEENKERRKEHYKKYSEENKEKMKQWGKLYREENKEKMKQLHKQWHKENKDKIKQYSKQYREENKEKTRTYHNLYQNQRRKTDPIFRLSCNIRNSINRSLNNKGYSKNTNTYKILGLEYEDFYTWLNTKASNGLDFDKDDVHVDHVIPVSFGKTEEQVLALNHYSNLQLLTSEENINKKNKYIKQSNLDRVMTNHPNNSLLTKILLNYDYLIF